MKFELQIGLLIIFGLQYHIYYALECGMMVNIIMHSVYIELYSKINSVNFVLVYFSELGTTAWCFHVL